GGHERLAVDRAAEDVHRARRRVEALERPGRRRAQAEVGDDDAPARVHVDPVRRPARLADAAQRPVGANFGAGARLVGGPAARVAAPARLAGLAFFARFFMAGMLHRLFPDRDGFLHDVGSKPQSNVRRTSERSSAWATSAWVFRAKGWATRVSARPWAPRSTRPRRKRYSTKRRASCSGAGAVREPRSSAAEATSNRRTSPGASTTSARPSSPNSSALSESRRVWVSPPAAAAVLVRRARAVVPGAVTTLAV